MKKYTKIIYITSLAIMSISCETNNALPNENPRELVEVQVMLADQTISESGYKNTRVNIGGNQFEHNDTFRFFFNLDKPDNTALGVTSGDSDDKRTEYTYNDTTKKWAVATSAQPLYWDDHTSVNRSFCGIIPFNEYDAATHTFHALTDQSDAADYKKSDLLMARVNTDKRLIPLSFNHIMARVKVVITASTNPASEEAFSYTGQLSTLTVSLNGIKTQAGVTYDALTTNDVTYDPKVTVTAVGTPTTITKMYEESKNNTNNVFTGNYLCIIPPQPYTDLSNPLLTITMNDGPQKKHYYLNLKNNVDFRQGKNLTINVTLHKSKVQLDDATITIQGWEPLAASGDDEIQLEQ